MKIKLGILISLILLLTGCTSYTELSDLSIVSTIGIDYQEDKYHLTVNVIDGKLDDQEIEKSITTFTSENTSLEEAFNDIYLKSSKKLYLSHLDLLIITEDAINQKFSAIIHNFLENNEYRNNFNVVLLSNTSLSDFMTQNIQAEDINNLIATNQKETALSVVKDFEMIVKELLIDKNSYLPTISYLNEELTLNGFTLIKNYQIYETLTLEESILLNMLQNKVNKAYLNGSNIFENQTLVTTKQNHITFHFITTINKDNNFEEKTKQQLTDLLTKYQNEGYDILKLTEKVRKNDYSYYKETKDLLSKLTFGFSFEIKEKENYLQGDAFDETK